MRVLYALVHHHRVHTRWSTRACSYTEVHRCAVIPGGPLRTSHCCARKRPRPKWSVSVDLPVEGNHPALPLSPAKWTSRYSLRVEVGAGWTSRYARPLNMVDFPVYRPCEDLE